MEALKSHILDPMWGFMLRYFFWLGVLFAGIYFETFSPLIFLNNLQTDLTIFVTQYWITFFDIPVEIFGATLIYDHGLKLEIVKECNGLAPFLFFLAALISYPASFKVKIFWGFFSYMLLFFANIIRVDWILYHVIDHPEDFELIHEVIGRYFIAIIPLLLFYFFSNRRTNSQ